MQSPGAENHIQIRGIARQGGHQALAAFQTSVQKCFVQGCVGLQHLKSIGFRHIPTIRVGLNHHERNLIPLQLGCDFLTDAPVAAEDDVVVQSFQHAVDAELLQSAEIARVLQSQHPLNGQLNDDQATDHDQHRHQASSGERVSTSP